MGYISRSFLIFAAILLLGIISRFIWIDKVPHSINGDQLHYILNSKSFALTGKDLTQSVNLVDILIFHYPRSEVVQAELPYFLDMLTVGWMPFSLAANALPNALLSLLTIAIIYLITKRLLNEQIAIIAGFITAINPWFIAIGRTSYEMIPAPFFYLLAFYILLITKGWKILYVLPVFILAFYSYIATKLIFLPLVLLFCLYCYFVVNKKRFGKQYILLVLILVSFVCFFALQLNISQGTSRTSEIITPFSPFIEERVDLARKISIINPLTPLFENKLTMFVRIIFDNTFKTLGYDYLFLKGDYFFALGKHGLFYVIDFIFIFIGMFWMLNKNKKLFIFLILLIATSMLPNILHISVIKNGNFSPHTTMLVPFLVILISAGIWRTIELVKKGKKIVAAVIIILYLFLFGNFLNIYFFQLPIQHNFFNFPNRLLSNYISRAQAKGQHVFVYTRDPRGKFKEYLFYSNTYNRSNVQEVAKALEVKKYKINDVVFLPCGEDITKIEMINTIITHIDCNMRIKGNNNIIPELSDSGEVYKIINDTLCSKYELKRYISNFKVNDFDLDKMSPEQFCQTFITSL